MSKCHIVGNHMSWRKWSMSLSTAPEDLEKADNSLEGVAVFVMYIAEPISTCQPRVRN